MFFSVLVHLNLFVSLGLGVCSVGIWAAYFVFISQFRFHLDAISYGYKKCISYEIAHVNAVHNAVSITLIQHIVNRIILRCVVELLLSDTAWYLSFHPIGSLQFSCCNLSVREKAWRSRARGATAT